MFCRNSRFVGAASDRIPSTKSTKISNRNKNQSKNISSPDKKEKHFTSPKTPKRTLPKKLRKNRSGRLTPGGSKNTCWSPVPSNQMEKDLKDEIKEKDIKIQMLMSQLQSHGDEGITGDCSFI